MSQTEPRFSIDTTDASSSDADRRDTATSPASTSRASTSQAATSEATGDDFESTQPFDESDGSTAIDQAVLAAVNDPQMQILASPYVGQWNQLISTTNWSKGEIISQWRQRLVESDADSAAYSDEAWARTVGGISGQHVGRLRRVFDAFGETYESYQGLYWSHFLAALDWDDAPMWLEGAVQSGWSVSQMRAKRWATLGQIESDRPNDADIVSSEVDEDYEPVSAVEEDDDSERFGTTGPLMEGPDFADADRDGIDVIAGDIDDSELIGDASQTVSPFANLPDLPSDVEDALEMFKLSIVRHRSQGWADISQSDMLRVVMALQSLVNAPSE